MEKYPLDRWTWFILSFSLLTSASITTKIFLHINNLVEDSFQPVLIYSMNIRKFFYFQADRLVRMRIPVTALGRLGMLEQGVYPDER